MREVPLIGLGLFALAAMGCGKDAVSRGGADAAIGGRGSGGAAGAGTANGGTLSSGGITAGEGGGGAGGALLKCPPPPFGPIPAGSCNSPDDTDRDGVPDCKDPCPYDKNKLAAGVCGCGTADIDSDGDGVADCHDLCPFDSNNTVAGLCGCVGHAALQPQGTPCSDPACPQADATCDGAGVCGDRKGCSPCPGGHFVQPPDDDVGYWFCGSLPQVTGPGCVAEDGGGGPGVTRAVAKAACAAKGLSLLRIGTLTENRFIAQFLTSRVWLGANDLGTQEEWYWPSATSDSDTLFWSGGPDGSRADGHYFNWTSGAPAGASCASLNPADGRWSDTDCNEKLAYICERL